MRKNIFIVFIGLISLSACKKDFLEQTDPNAITVDQFFTSPNDVLLAVNGVYQSLRSSNNIGESSNLYTEQRSDNTGTNDNQSNAGEPFQFGDFSILPSNTYLKNHWVSLYSTITRCNVITSNIDKVPFADANLKAQYLAETKFVRALIYFHLVRKWGDVPLVTKQLTSNNEVVENTFRQPQSVVYAQIVADLKDALNSNLPNLATGASAGRASKAAINGLLGQVYLTIATTLESGKAENLTNANTYLLAAYNLKNFNSLAAIPYADVFDVTKKTNNPEVIFEIVNLQGNITYASSIAANNQAFGETLNSRRAPTGVGGNVTPDLVLDYESGDPRKDFSIKYAADTRVLDWFITKYRDASEAATVNGYGGNNFPLMRFADIILMLAEVNMLQGNDAMAIQYLDMVRARAGVPLYAVVRNNATYSAKYPTLKLAILHERRVELAFENHRWFDLLRNFTTAELVTYFRAKSQANFGNAKLSNFSTKDRYFPIPFDEYKLDPAKMYQNPGY